MTIKNPFVRKIVDIRYRYGAAAVMYFKSHPHCERCSEARLAALSVHHKQGKQVEEFETLCFNCHMIEHAVRPEYTHDDYVAEIEARLQQRRNREERDRRISTMRQKGASLRTIAAVVDLSHVRVRNILSSSPAVPAT